MIDKIYYSLFGRDGEQSCNTVPHCEIVVDNSESGVGGTAKLCE